MVVFEGKTYEELKDRAEYQAWLDSGGTIAFPEGEEQKEFRSRCVRGMLGQVDRLCEENVESAAFVVHGGTIMAVLEQLAEDLKRVFITGRWKMAEDIECLLTKMSGSQGFIDFVKFKNWEE